jgi:hypothetical protein
MQYRDRRQNIAVDNTLSILRGAFNRVHFLLDGLFCCYILILKYLLPISLRV